MIQDISGYETCPGVQPFQIRKIGFSTTMNHLAYSIDKTSGKCRENVLRRGHRAISIHGQLAGLDIQGFPEVLETFEANIISRQGLDVGGLY